MHHSCRCLGIFLSVKLVCRLMELQGLPPLEDRSISLFIPDNHEASIEKAHLIENAFLRLSFQDRTEQPGSIPLFKMARRVTSALLFNTTLSK